MAYLLVAVLALAPASSAWIGFNKQETALDRDEVTWVSGRTVSTVDVADWRINDNWMYDGYLDVADFVADSGVESNVESLEGTLDRTVEDIYVTDIDGISTLVYEVVSVGSYETNGVISIDGTNGCLFVDMETTEIIRASDMATHSQDVAIDVYFDPAIFGGCWSALRQTIGLLNVDNSYDPPLENYDFPLGVGESWGMDFQQDTDYSGSSNYVDIPDDSSDSNSTSWAVVSQGNSGVSYPGCYQSYNVTNYDADGDESGYNWYCPAIRGEVKSSVVQSFGFLAVHELTSYQPVQRGKTVSIDVEYPLSPIGIDISAWINVSNQGQPVGSQDIQFRYESEQLFQNVTTESNGSFHLVFNSGDKPDNTTGAGELGSHGLVAWIADESVLGARSLLIDSDIHEIDLVTSTTGVTVQRLRNANGNPITLDSSIGFNAIEGDTLTFSVPILNRGLISSPESTLVIHTPDGSYVNGIVPPLSSLQQSRVELHWPVPQSQSFGNVYFDFTVDPDEEISEDGNRSNNAGSFALFIGALPTSSLIVSNESLTLDSVFIDGSASMDPDGGSIVCEFRVVDVEGNLQESVGEGCVFEWTWDDEGEYDVFLVVTDEENDIDQKQASVVVYNRPPEIVLGADSGGVVVTNPITFRILESSDLDTQNPSAPIEFLWAPDCEEGRVGNVCTITPMLEGNYTIELLATDDDGATTLATHTVNVSNIAPSNPVAELYVGSERLFPDSRGVFVVQEDEQITFWGQADDSSNDMDSLVHIWHPDAEDYPELNFTSVGRLSTLANQSYHSSGMHLATLLVIDDNGAEADTLVVPVQVENLPPSISPIPSLQPLEEDEEFTIHVSVSDTSNDIGSLEYCFDLSPDEDSDSDGSSDNDCDHPSNTLLHSWPDSLTAPSHIVFHVTDDDGEVDSVEIPFEVINAPPTAMASASVVNPTEGDSIVLSANGTVDSQVDMDSLQFHWDIDVTHDSDGDGNPSNDVDFTGRWIEFSYDSEGAKQAKLTVLDESSSHSVTMDIQVAEAPFSLSETVKSHLLPAILAIIVIAGAVFAGLRLSPKRSEDSPKSEEPMDFDAAFDDSGGEAIDPGQEFRPLPGEIPQDSRDPIIEGLDELLGDIHGGAQGEIPPAPDLGAPAPEEDMAKALLDQEDIEALFEE